MSLYDTYSKEELANLASVFNKLKKEGIVEYYNLETGKVRILSTLSLIKRLERHVYSAFRIAFPDSMIRKSAVDMYLAALMNSYLKTGLDKESGLVMMMLNLEQESERKFKDLSRLLEKEFGHYNFEKIKLQ